MQNVWVLTVLLGNIRLKLAKLYYSTYYGVVATPM